MQFNDGIDKISVEFNKFFVLMFGGGEAGLNKVKIKSNNEEESDKITKDEGDMTTNVDGIIRFKGNKIFLN